MAEVNKAATIGGSDVAGIMGLSPFRTPLDVWREKVLGQRDDVDTPATRAGTRFEPHILDAYRAQLPAGSTVTRPEPIVDGHRRASLDALAEVRGFRAVVEAKSTLYASDWGENDTDQVRLDYLLQGAWYADLTGADEIHYPVLLWPRDMRDLLGLAPAEIVASCELRVLRVTFSATLATTIRQRVDSFWRDNVLAETPPPAVDLDDIKRLVRVVRGKSVEADHELVDLLVQRDAAKAALKAADDRVKALDFALRQRIGDAEQVVAPNGDPIVTLKQIDKAAYAVKAQSYRELRTTKHWKKLNTNPEPQATQ